MEQKRFPAFAERFAKLRGEKTQGEFADFLGISRPTVGFYENGTRIPDALVLRQISEKCQVSADWLLGLSGSKKRAPSAVDELGLSENAIAAVELLSREERSVLSFLIEQEQYSGESEVQSSHYVKSGGCCIPDKIHVIRRISDYFYTAESSSADCFITDKGEIVNEWDLEECNLNCDRIIPIETWKLVNEAFLSDIRSMIVQLKAEYRKQEGCREADKSSK